jgi:hypothetical protein
MNEKAGATIHKQHIESLYVDIIDLCYELHDTDYDVRKILPVFDYIERESKISAGYFKAQMAEIRKNLKGY